MDRGSLKNKPYNETMKQWKPTTYLQWFDQENPALFGFVKIVWLQGPWMIFFGPESCFRKKIPENNNAVEISGWIVWFRYWQVGAFMTGAVLAQSYLGTIWYNYNLSFKVPYGCFLLRGSWFCQRYLVHRRIIRNARYPSTVPRTAFNDKKSMIWNAHT